jgi:anti-anti-sigma factor
MPNAATGTALPAGTWEGHTARCTVRWGRAGAVIEVDGELDAANAGQLADYIHRCSNFCEWLVLDLCALEFIGTAGFSMLQTINNRCAKAKVSWAIVPGGTTSRLLRVCDPDSALPTTESVAGALSTVQGYQQLLRPVATS